MPSAASHSDIITGSQQDPVPRTINDSFHQIDVDHMGMMATEELFLGQHSIQITDTSAHNVAFPIDTMNMCIATI